MSLTKEQLLREFEKEFFAENGEMSVETFCRASEFVLKAFTEGAKSAFHVDTPLTMLGDLSINQYAEKHATALLSDKRQQVEKMAIYQHVTISTGEKKKLVPLDDVLTILSE